jgi:hypothetical protein
MSDLVTAAIFGLPAVAFSFGFAIWAEQRWGKSKAGRILEVLEVEAYPCGFHGTQQVPDPLNPYDRVLDRSK